MKDRQTNMSSWSQEEMLSPLDKIQRVEAPEFLYTRIQAKIQSNEAQKSLNPSLKWVLAFGFAALLLVNVWVINSSISKEIETSYLTSEVAGIEIANSNQLYSND